MEINRKEMEQHEVMIEILGSEKVFSPKHFCLRINFGSKKLVGLDDYTVAAVQNATFGNLFDCFIELGLIC